MEKSKTQFKGIARKGGKEAVQQIKAIKDESTRLRAMKRLPLKEKALFEEDESAAIQSEAKWAKKFLPPKPPKPPKAPKGEGKEKEKEEKPSDPAAGTPAG
jgi:hypothetical protein